MAPVNTVHRVRTSRYYFIFMFATLGTHLMIEIPDTLQHKDNESVYSKAGWKHGVPCSECKQEVIGERYFCTSLRFLPPPPASSSHDYIGSTCNKNLCAMCRQKVKHDPKHNLIVYLRPQAQKN